MTYRMSGNPQDYRGTRFTLTSTAETRIPGTHLGDMDGTWDGDRLELRMTPLVVDEDNSVRSDHQPTGPVTFEMRRSSAAEFEDTCRQADAPR
ncbi:hypothetical protein [Nonomuraea jiangxiensis]|uniref:Uncharacterized protein n=1 Tax=Nonomuraea jiangxiensis TaxID=633440 RepID=A0A1G9QZ29_9ACTN|nr:hypothetical protein [Nonomuraea jiangxiensis]SDM16131.1 hypothetical protein SAMN05421869_13760 [Nonomuraea jiangxiensis]